ncbi:unnamed protein product [Cuscuta europaea]|uniref:Uncharacterized protein n=1 Tax=Cuscuta europaea TaxID=41803 RepID=A0A9P1EC53_CUSEU|nr:unnamed protein product [Cuscuta europaea]
MKGKEVVVEEVNMKDKKKEFASGKTTYLRPKRGAKAAEVLKSPYMARVVDPNDTSNAQEKQIWKWVMQDATDKRDDILFKYKQITINRGEMLTLGEKKHMCSKVIDAWTVCLNNKEKIRSSTSP